ncbi:MAG: ABC transporter ATP-binding protein [Dysgonamonadaceae bacterium]|jgi:ABC-type multidrug transport system ATPase subunit|nr:ABC transporter ATP-binding protein [Dysgonamonadaceae bacterium]
MIVADNIHKNYREVEALKGVGFTVNAGEIFGLIGPDGAGKTTLFRILTTLITADSGRATIDGLDTVTDFEQIRKRIGYMPGKFALYQDLTVEENLKFYATVFNTTVEENYELVREIYGQLEPFANRRAGALSGGMKQKLALSCALIHRPAVLMLDEPTTGVDPVSRGEFQSMLERLKRQGITILISTPYMDEANRCDRIALIQNGKILTVDSPDKIIASYPDSLYAAKSDNNYRLLGRLNERPDVKRCYVSGEYLRVTFNTEAVPALDGVEIKPVQPTVEDCFIYLNSKRNNL